MFFLFLGVVLFFIAGVLPANPNFPATWAKTPLRTGGILIAVIGLLTSCIKQIDAGEVGVQKLFGKVKDHVLESGLNFINPFVNVVPVNVRTQNYTMSGIHTEGKQAGDDAIRILSSDGLELTIDLTILYHANKQAAPKIIREIGSDYEDVIVRPVSRTKIRDNAVFYAAIELYSIKREEFQARIYRDIDSLFKMRGLTLEQLLIRNITLPLSVKATIESKINAEQDAQKMQYVLQKETQEAERKRVEAQGIADYQRILSQGLSDKMLQYEQIKAMKELSLSQNSKVIVVGNKSGGNILISDK
jgi:regulator of protease activity HflC (stomatin/prohibitin superfamily)